MSSGTVNKHNTAIDLLKFIFAVVIVLFHGWKRLPGQGSYFINGRLGVEIFFIISGFLMVASSKRYANQENISLWRKTGSFILHKVARLSPDVFIAWFIAFYVTYVLPGEEGLLHKLLSGGFEFFLIWQAGFSDFTHANGAVWYLSAMLLAMMFLFPVLLKNREFYLYWFAPLAALFFYGFLAIKYGKLIGSDRWTGFATMGMLRAVSGLCLGAVCYNTAEKLKTVNFRLPGKMLISIASFLSIAYVIYTVYGHDPSEFDFVLVALLAIGVTLLFSERGINVLGYAPDAVNRFIMFLGELSLDIYLSNVYWCRNLGTVFPDLSGKRMLLVYLVIVFVNAILLMLVSKFLRKIWPAVKNGMKILVCNENKD